MCFRGFNSECVDLVYIDGPFNSNRNYAAPVGSKAAGAAFKDTWTLSDLDVAWMGLVADEQPAVYQVLQAAGLTHGKGMQSYLCWYEISAFFAHSPNPPARCLSRTSQVVIGRGCSRTHRVRGWPSRTARMHPAQGWFHRWRKGRHTRTVIKRRRREGLGSLSCSSRCL